MCTNCCAVSGGGLAAGPHRPPQPGGNVYTPLGTQLIYHIYTCRSAAYDTRLSQVLLIRLLKRPCYKVSTSRPRALPVPAAVASSQEKEWVAKRVTMRLFEGVHDDAAARAHSHRVSACMLVCTIDAARVERCTHRGRAQTRRSVRVCVVRQGAILLFVELYVGGGLTNFTHENSSSYCEIGPFQVTCALR